VLEIVAIFGDTFAVIVGRPPAIIAFIPQLIAFFQKNPTTKCSVLFEQIVLDEFAARLDEVTHQGE
jgi:hypothetical protein